MQTLIVSQIITLILLIVSELLPFINRNDINGVIQGVRVLMAQREMPVQEPANIVMVPRTDPPTYVNNPDL